MILLLLRLKQISRELNTVRLYLFPILILLSLLLVVSYSLHKSASTSLFQMLFLFGACLTIQFYRDDKSFIYRNIKNPRLEIYLEYFAATVLLSCATLLTSHWYYFFIFQGFLALVPFISFNLPINKFYYKAILRIIEPAAFELLSGARQSLLFLILLLLGAVGLAWVKFLPLFFLWLITITVASFYNECESVQVLRSKALRPKLFLITKILMNVKYIFIVYAPVLLVNTFFNQDYWVVNLLFLLVQMSVLVFAITYKYVCYSPNESLKSSNIMISALSFGSILPYFLPVPTIMSVVYFSKAKANLNRYL